jgi:serine protease Do
MSRRFVAAVIGLSGTAGLLLGLVIAGSMTPQPAISSPAGGLGRDRPIAAAAPASPMASFADVAARVNPAVVNIDASSRGGGRQRRRSGPSFPSPRDPIGPTPDRERDGPRRGTGTGFIIDPAGHILTSQHVVEPADRLTVRLADGRSFRARRIGTDPDTDIALIKVDASEPLPFAPLGDSDRLRVGEWVMAIGNPLAYEHTATVGIVSFIGRKLFNASFDRYIQTDAGINLGNSGGPLINGRGEVVGINGAVSSRAANIGFAVPINQATEILPQLRADGRVRRGDIGVLVRDVDSDLRRSLQLRSVSGAFVQDVTPGSPGARAGLRAYDIIVAVDGAAVAGDEALIQLIASRRPGTVASLQVLRDNRAMTVAVKLAERPRSGAPAATTGRDVSPGLSWKVGGLGLKVRELDAETVARSRLPDGLAGVMVSRVEPISPAADAEIAVGHVLLEINRQPVRTLQEYERVVGGVRGGDILALYVYRPELMQRTLHTVRLD